jgi:hypothetical protein
MLYSWTPVLWPVKVLVVEIIAHWWWQGPSINKNKMPQPSSHLIIICNMDAILDRWPVVCCRSSVSSGNGRTRGPDSGLDEQGYIMLVSGGKNCHSLFFFPFPRFDGSRVKNDCYLFMDKSCIVPFSFWLWGGDPDKTTATVSYGWSMHPPRQHIGHVHL